MEKINDAKKCYKFNDNICFDNNISILDINFYLKSAYLWNCCW